MPARNIEKEARIAAASTGMDANPLLKASLAARQLGAPYHTLLRRREGRPASNSQGGHNKKLSTVQDIALKDYIFMLHDCGTPANKEAVRIAANRLLFYNLVILKIQFQTAGLVTGLGANPII